MRGIRQYRAKLGRRDRLAARGAGDEREEREGLGVHDAADTGQVIQHLGVAAVFRLFRHAVELGAHSEEPGQVVARDALQPAERPRVLPLDHVERLPAGDRLIRQHPCPLLGAPVLAPLDEVVEDVEHDEQDDGRERKLRQGSREADGDEERAPDQRGAAVDRLGTRCSQQLRDLGVFLGLSQHEDLRQ